MAIFLLITHIVVFILNIYVWKVTFLHWSLFFAYFIVPMFLYDSLSKIPRWRRLLTIWLWVLMLVVVLIYSGVVLMFSLPH